MKPKSLIVEAAVVLGIGLVLGLASNITAGPQRRVGWGTDYPDKKVKDCRTEPEVAVTPPVIPQPEGTAPSTDSADLSGISLPVMPAEAAWVEIDSTQALKAFREGALFIDARLTQAYEEGHVQGALSVAVWEDGVDDKVAQLPFAAQGDLSRVVVAYCNGGDCEDSHTLGEKMRGVGFTTVYVYKDGWPDWLAKGRPHSTGGTP